MLGQPGQNPDRCLLPGPGEIDRCLKKVSEGVEQFEDIWQKVRWLVALRSGCLGRTQEVVLSWGKGCLSWC